MGTFIIIWLSLDDNALFILMRMMFEKGKEILSAFAIIKGLSKICKLILSVTDKLSVCQVVVFSYFPLS